MLMCHKDKRLGHAGLLMGKSLAMYGDFDNAIRCFQYARVRNCDLEVDELIEEVKSCSSTSVSAADSFDRCLLAFVISELRWKNHRGAYKPSKRIIAMKLDWINIQLAESSSLRRVFCQCGGLLLANVPEFHRLLMHADASKMTGIDLTVLCALLNLFTTACGVAVEFFEMLRRMTTPLVQRLVEIINALDKRTVEENLSELRRKIDNIGQPVDERSRTHDLNKKETIDMLVNMKRSALELMYRLVERDCGTWVIAECWEVKGLLMTMQSIIHSDPSAGTLDNVFGIIRVLFNHRCGTFFSEILTKDGAIDIGSFLVGYDDLLRGLVPSPDRPTELHGYLTITMLYHMYDRIDAFGNCAAKSASTWHAVAKLIEAQIPHIETLYNRDVALTAVGILLVLTKRRIEPPDDNVFNDAAYLVFCGCLKIVEKMASAQFEDIRRSASAEFYHAGECCIELMHRLLDQFLINSSRRDHLLTLSMRAVYLSERFTTSVLKIMQLADHEQRPWFRNAVVFLWKCENTVDTFKTAIPVRRNDMTLNQIICFPNGLTLIANFIDVEKSANDKFSTGTAATTSALGLLASALHR